MDDFKKFENNMTLEFIREKEKEELKKIVDEHRNKFVSILEERLGQTGIP